MIVGGGLHRSIHHSSPCHGRGQRRDHNDQSRRWSRVLVIVSLVRLPGLLSYHSRTPIASPLSARTFWIVKFLMMTFFLLLTILSRPSASACAGFQGNNLQAKANKLGARILPNDAGVASNLHLISSLGDRSGDNNDLGGVTRNCGRKLGVGGHCGCSSSFATGSATIEAMYCVSLNGRDESRGAIAGFLLTWHSRWLHQ